MTASGSTWSSFGREDVAGAVRQLELTEDSGSLKSTPRSKIFTFSTDSVSS